MYSHVGTLAKQKLSTDVRIVFIMKKEKYFAALDEEGSSKNCHTFHCSLLTLFGICAIIAASAWR